MQSEPPSPRRPGLAKSGTLPRRIRAAAVVRHWCNRHRVTEREFAGVVDVNKRTADEMLDASRPIPLDTLFSDELTERHALDLLDELRLAILSRRSA